jgi:Asp-tRNA(Asn)/Glu-tRNA(Gln) amidotransferase A subunit family amidase
MSIRYLYNITIALAAGFLVVATQAFAAPTVAWLTFAIAVGATALGAGMLFTHGGMSNRALAGVGVALGIWTIVASLVFAPATVVWLGFASALAFVGLALVGLTLHELTTERVVHSLEVESARTLREDDSLIAA